MENNKKKLQIPSTCALLFMLMIVCAILTWIVPAGEFDTEKVDNLNKVIAGTYHTVEASPVGPWATIMAVVQGFYKAAKLMVMIMFVGGAVEILEKTGAIHAAFGKLASKQNLNVNVLVFLVMAFMSIGGAAGVFANPVVALIPIGIILATNLGYDSFHRLPACIYGRLLRIQRRLGERFHYRYCTADRGAPDVLRFRCPRRIKHHQLCDLLFLYDPLHENHQGGSEEELKL